MQYASKSMPYAFIVNLREKRIQYASKSMPYAFREREKHAVCFKAYRMLEAYCMRISRCSDLVIFEMTNLLNDCSNQCYFDMKMVITLRCFDGNAAVGRDSRHACRVQMGAKFPLASFHLSFAKKRVNRLYSYGYCD
jgi:hypothetical protein